MKTNFLILLMLLGFTGSPFAQTISPEHLQSDFDLFRKALGEVHPQMYLYTSKQTFDSLFTATRSCLNKSMTSHEFYKTMLPLVVTLHDGHIKWIPSGRDEHYPFFTDKQFPLHLYFTGKKAWVAGNYGESDIPKGSEIRSINGYSVESIIGTLLPNMTFSDGFSTQGKYEDLNHFFSGYFATHFGPFQEFEIVYEHNGLVHTSKLAAVTEQTIKAYKDLNKPASQLPFRLQVTGTRAVMTIERFWDDKKEQDYKTFLKDSFRELKKHHVTHLILDVRNNEGGNEPYGVLLYSYLARKPFRYYDHIKVAQKKKITFQAWSPKIYTSVIRKYLVKKRENGYVFTFPKGLKKIKPKANAFNGDLFVLVNGNSFSVTTEFAARAHADGRAIFIGQETGGGYRTNSSGMFTVVQLPHTKIDLGIPMFGFQMADIPPSIPFGRGIIPHYTVVPSIQDVLQHKDPVMDYTLKLIQEKAAAGTPAAVASPNNQ
jgi:hypothetical protein